ncbi:MAG: 1-acyl-sn-glycerol-3-phosphate acyltransferase [Clostridia bacterium]|nr:1-acyl-sn-glycerol-3-phosphate acyltransferase [Clostridia bacterium]
MGDKKNKKPNIFSRAIACLLRPLLRVIWHVKIYFPERFPSSGAAICVCNHFSAMDANRIMSSLIKRDYRVMIKGEMFKSKFIGDILRSLGGIPVARGEGDIGAVRQVFACIKEGKKIIIFPEGTRSKCRKIEDYQLLELKNGVPTIAIKTKCTVIPLMYYRKISPFRRNYLIVGNPFDFSEFYGQKGDEVELAANAKLREKMIGLYAEIKTIVEQFNGSQSAYVKSLSSTAAEE